MSKSEVALVSDVAAQDETVDLIKQFPAAAKNSKDDVSCRYKHAFYETQMASPYHLSAPPLHFLSIHSELFHVSYGLFTAPMLFRRVTLTPLPPANSGDVLTRGM